ncbi:hypothetical protein GWI33_003138 [Rhynchophorus ferrugineus]|uniref:27 kDa hemolymph protein n=1 Tax=Rhynchophorus ferrugineus TaxID=354439 RepID=A0A834IN73_RHYFE|nr:hypothetical protein GWI33_003138 [Rhynchophorus ferrugineus]
MVWTFYSLVLLSITGLALGQQVNLEDLYKQSKDLAGSDLTDLQSTLGNSFFNVPDVNVTSVHYPEVEKVLKKKCEEQGSKDALDAINNQTSLIHKCITTHVNVTQIQPELDEAKKTGSMDVVFAKYCKKWPEVYACVENVTLIVRQCLTETEEKSFNKTLTIIDELKEFMCFKDGDRLAMFVAEGGVECVQEQQNGITECLNSTFGEKVSDIDDLSASTLPIFAFTSESCEDFDKLRLCVNDVLEKCKDTTPANIVDAFFKFLKKQMPCETPALRVAADTASSSSRIFNSALGTFFILSLIKLY